MGSTPIGVIELKIPENLRPARGSILRDFFVYPSFPRRRESSRIKDVIRISIRR